MSVESKIRWNLDERWKHGLARLGKRIVLCNRSRENGWPGLPGSLAVGGEAAGSHRES
jgi:hypothetical protein